MPTRTDDRPRRAWQESASGPLLGGVFAIQLGVEAAAFIGLAGYAIYVLGVAAPLNTLIMGMFLCGQFLSVPIAGTLIDRWGPRRFMMAALILVAVICTSALLIGARVALFLVFAFCFGLGITLPQTGMNSFGPFVVKGTEALQQVNAAILFASFVAASLGPALGGALATYFGVPSVYVFCAAMAVVACVFWWFTIEKYQVEPEVHDSELHELTHGLRLTLTDETLRFYVLAGSLVWFAIGSVMVLEGYYFEGVLKLPVAWLGWSAAASGVGTVLGSLLYARLPKRLLNSQSLLVTVIGIGLSLCLVYGTHSVVAMMIGSFLFGLPFGMAEPLLRTLTHSVSPLESVGRIQAAARLFRIVFTIVPLLFAAWISRLFGIQTVLVGSALVVVAICLALFVEARRIDRGVAVE